MKCLACSAEMTSMRCACGGAWICEAELVELAHDARGTLVTLPWATRSGEARACPECTQPMRTVGLAGVALDRCFDHGIWFDAGELQAVMRKAEAFPVENAPTPVQAAPPRAIAATSAPAPVEVAVADDSSGDTASGVLAFFGALLEIIIDVATD
jgi:Zn-finger nucleic acid-binding protein